MLEEIDKHKKGQDSVGLNARNIIRNLDELRSKGSLEKGVRLGKGRGILKVMSYEILNESSFPSDLDPSVADHIIIATGCAVQKTYPKRKTIVVSRDINMRVICDSVGLMAEDYTSEKAVNNSEELYQGFSEFLVDDQFVDRFYNGEELYIAEDETEEKWFPNQYLLLISNSNPKKTCIARFTDHQAPLRRIVNDKVRDWNISSRNKEQAFAIDMLLDPNIKLIYPVGS